MKTKPVSVTATVTFPIEIEIEVPDSYNGSSEEEREEHLSDEALSIVSELEIEVPWDLQTSSESVVSCVLSGDPEIIPGDAWVL